VRKGEIKVTRRLFRSGDSEYLLNGKLCRLRDIQDLFMGTGLGPESYAIIEQGRIGQILSSKPYDRRAIIEEAAGITKFKTRKRLAEARLEQAKLNLARVNDIFDEVTRQMNSLKRQASKAERYARLRDEMRGRLRVVLASKFAEMERQSAELERELAALAESVRLGTEQVESLDAEHGERAQRGYAIESETRAAGDRLNQIALESDRARARRKHNEERAAELEARSAAAEAEVAQTGTQLEALRAERESNRRVVESAAGEVAAAQAESALRQQEAVSAATTLADVERLQEQRRHDLFDALTAASGVRSQMAQAEERVAALRRETSRIHGERDAARGQLEAFGGERGQLALAFESASQRVTAVGQQIVASRRRLEEGRAAEKEAKARLDGLRAEYATALGKKGSLEAVIAEHGYSTESVKRLFQSGIVHQGFAPVGVLADFIEVNERYESVVEDFLRDELNYVVVKSWDSADEGLRMLRTDVDGRATFLVHPNDSQAKFSFAVDDHNRAAPPSDAIVPLKNSIRVLNGFGRSLEVILPKLRDGWIAPDPQVARDLALRNPDAFFLSQSGECFHNVTVTGGKQRAEGPLSLKRELRDVVKLAADLEGAMRSEETRVATLGREISELTSLLERLEEEKREGETQAMTAGHSLRQLDGEVERIQERLDTYARELERTGREQAAEESAIAALREQLAAHEQRQWALETETAAAQESLAALKLARDAAAQTASEMLARVAVLEERQRAAAGALQRIESMTSEVEARVNALHAQIASAAAEKQQREAENLQIAEQLVAFAAEAEQAQVRLQELQAESAEVRARVAAVEEEMKTARAALDAARDRRGELSATAARLESDTAHMAETCLNDLGIPRDALLADESVTRLEGEALAVEETAYRELRAKLDNMGPVNMMALEEYNETAQRHAFLEAQRKDLLESIENTQNTIREIDAISREKFKEAFEKINENFQVTFGKLFGGGHAFMRLTDEENAIESGLDIVASPPGKKLQNVLLLSGGEKALTALALLVGIFQYQPSPFCILDEVDAPLDETNCGRFAELLGDLSNQTQFVVITHSKKTMNRAEAMYGVTMQEPGVSKVVSVRFGEAKRASA
jgi:chromosome segregation protein